MEDYTTTCGVRSSIVVDRDFGRKILFFFPVSFLLSQEFSILADYGST